MSAQKRRLLTLAACVAVIFLAPLLAAHGILLSGIIGHYGLSDAQQGYPSAAQNLGCLVSMFTSLWVIGRVSKQALSTLAIAVMTVAMLPLSLLPGFPTYLALYALVGVAFAYVDSIASSMIADLHPGENASRMMCLMHASHGLAGILLPPVIRAAMGGEGNLPRAYMAIFAMGIAALLIVAPIHFKFRLPDNAERPEPMSLVQLRAFFGMRSLRALSLAILFYGIHLTGMIVWISRYIEIELHRGALGALSLSLLYAGITGSRLIVSAIRIPPYTYMRRSCVLGAMAMGIGLIAQNAYVMCGAVVLCALLSGSVIPVAIGTACSEFSSNTMLASALMMLAMLIGNSISSPLIGMVEARSGMTWGMSIPAAALMLCGLIVLFAQRRLAATRAA